MRQILPLILSLCLPAAQAGMSISEPVPADYRAQLSKLTDLLTVEAEGGFRALQNKSLSPALLGGAIILTNPRPDWIEQSRELRLGLAQQGWDLMTAQPSSDANQTLKRAQALIDAHRTAGNKRILIVALENQAGVAIELAKEAKDLRLLLFNASENSTALEEIKRQIETLGKALTIELYSKGGTPSEGEKRHLYARKLNLATYRGRALIGPPLPSGSLNHTATKRILGAIKTLIIEFEQQKT